MLVIDNITPAQLVKPQWNILNVLEQLFLLCKLLIFTSNLLRTSWNYHLILNYEAFCLKQFGNIFILVKLTILSSYLLTHLSFYFFFLFFCFSFYFQSLLGFIKQNNKKKKNRMKSRKINSTTKSHTDLLDENAVFTNIQLYFLNITMTPNMHLNSENKPKKQNSMVQ